MPRLPILRSTLCALFVAVLATATAWAGHRKLSPELNDRLASLKTNPPAPLASDPLVEVIIQFRPGAKLTDGIKKVTGAGGLHKSRLDVINGGLFHVPASMLSTLADDPDVTYISADRKTIKLGKLDFIMDATNTTSIINMGYTGQGIGVAIIDSGVKTNHPDLANPGYSGGSRVVYSQSFIPGLDASDQYGHGTHVAGIIAGNGYVSGNWMLGVASRANIVNLRVLDAFGAGTDSAVISAIQRAIQLKNTYNIRIINLSLGRRISESYTLDPLCQAVEQAWKAGIVVVVAAGNYGRDDTFNTDGYGTITAPGNDPYVITVGAMNTRATDTTSDDIMTSYSSKGPTLLDHVIKPDLVAPGNRIVSLLARGSTLDTLYPQNQLSPSLYGSNSSTAYYTFMSGTSMAAPIVSGSVALMLEYQPNLTPDQVKARLMKTATKTHPNYSTSQSSNGTPYTAQYDIFTVGAGILDTYDAMASNDVPSGRALSPIAVRDASGNVRLQSDPSSMWGNSVIWEDSIVWGDSAFLNGSSIIWGDSVVWGDSTLSGYSVIWSDSIIWGDSLTGAFSSSLDYDKN
jgi:serine protease AprX